MTSSDPAASFRPSRHILAAALCPLAAGPLAAALGWDATEGVGSFNVIWLYVRTHVLLAYIAAAPAIPIMWMLRRWTRVRPQARVIIPLLTKMFALSATIAFASPGAGVVSLPQGLPIAVTYCLVACTPWSAPKP